jgi:damage-control phosphatase, subfamily I
MDHRCFLCFTKAFEKLLEKEDISDEQKSAFTKEMMDLYTRSHDQHSAPSFSRELHILLRQYTHNDDPYKTIKQEYNQRIMNMYPVLKEKIFHSTDIFNTALRFAIAGNIIDFANGGGFDIDKTLDHVMNSDFAIDNSDMLIHDIINAETILYLGDNAGEIVFDKLFIESLGHQNIYFAVRSAPVINDVTKDDAVYTGMSNVANVISNGYDAPSTLLEHCSSEFMDVFNKADVIISKGQGNLEGLMGKGHNNIFYLLMVKCDVIAEMLGVEKGSFVVTKETA